MNDDNINKMLKERGMLTIEQQLGTSPMDKFFVHTGVHDYQSFRSWLDMVHHGLVKQRACHELGIHVLSPDVDDFLLGQLKSIKEVVANLRNIEKSKENESCWTVRNGLL